MMENIAFLYFEKQKELNKNSSLIPKKRIYFQMRKNWKK